MKKFILAAVMACGLMIAAPSQAAASCTPADYYVLQNDMLGLTHTSENLELIWFEFQSTCTFMDVGFAHNLYREWLGFWGDAFYSDDDKWNWWWDYFISCYYGGMGG